VGELNFLHDAIAGISSEHFLVGTGKRDRFKFFLPLEGYDSGDSNCTIFST